jgi:hypothetical protein
MLSFVVSLLMLLTPSLAQQQNADLRFELRVDPSRLLGKGHMSGRDYYDVVITRQPNLGIPVKLDYTRRDATFSFDLHHRLSLTPDFVYPATITTTIEVLSGGTVSLGAFTIIDEVKQGATFEETIDKVSTADVDRYVTPFGRKRVSMKLPGGSQSLSIVGQSVITTRGARTTRMDTPNQRIAVVSNFKFVEDRPGTQLTIE